MTAAHFDDARSTWVLDTAGESHAADVRARRAVRCPPDRGPARRADAFDRELRAALAGTVRHTGCTNLYVDENGHDPNQWPWTWTTYRRRTARVEPAAYAIS